jgi:hypothetical protein
LSKTYQIFFRTTNEQYISVVSTDYNAIYYCVESRYNKAEVCTIVKIK